MSKGSDDIVVVVVVVAMTTTSGSSQHVPLNVGQACDPVDDTAATLEKPQSVTDRLWGRGRRGVRTQRDQLSVRVSD